MKNPALYSSECTTWATPWHFFQRCEQALKITFTIDTAADPVNTKCRKYYSEADNGLKQSGEGESAWCNHPYGAQLTRQWQAKAYIEAQKPRTFVTLLSPARTDTRAFHDWILTANILLFVKGRIWFEGATAPAPFPSLVAHWNGTDEHTIGMIESGGRHG